MRLAHVREHAEVVSNPKSDEIGNTIATNPLSVSCQEVKVEGVHVKNHPLGALAIAVLPCAVTTSLLGPQIDHSASEVEWICKE